MREAQVWRCYAQPLAPIFVLKKGAIELKFAKKVCYNDSQQDPLATWLFTERVMLAHMSRELQKGFSRGSD